jgi:hypothetical protein
VSECGLLGKDGLGFQNSLSLSDTGQRVIFSLKELRAEFLSPLLLRGDRRSLAKVMRGLPGDSIAEINDS